MNPLLSSLRKHLQALPAGPVPATAADTILTELATVWSHLPGSRQESTTPNKLYRAEELAWNPPYLSFVLARHGGTVMGSSREALHTWTVDLHSGECTLNTARHRQVRPMDERVTKKDLENIAHELLALIQKGDKTDDRLTWTKNGVTIRGAVDGNNNMTRKSRRRRFEAIMEPLLRAAGWERNSYAVFRFQKASTSSAPAVPEAPGKKS